MLTRATGTLESKCEGVGDDGAVREGAEMLSMLFLSRKIRVRNLFLLLGLPPSTGDSILRTARIFCHSCRDCQLGQQSTDKQLN